MIYLIVTFFFFYNDYFKPNLRFDDRYATKRLCGDKKTTRLMKKKKMFYKIIYVYGSKRERLERSFQNELSNVKKRFSPLPIIEVISIHTFLLVLMINKNNAFNLLCVIIKY